MRDGGKWECNIFDAVSASVDERWRECNVFDAVSRVHSTQSDYFHDRSADALGEKHNTCQDGHNTCQDGHNTCQDGHNTCQEVAKKKASPRRRMQDPLA